MSAPEVSPLEEVQRLAGRARRDSEGLAVVEGVAPFLQACAAEFEFSAIVWSRILLRSSAAQKLVRMKRREGALVQQVSPERFRAISRTTRASGVAGVIRQRWRRLADVDAHSGLCWIGLERIRSPGNLGTILRTAEAVGAAGLILLGPRIDPYAVDPIRTSMGAVFHLQLVRTSLESLVPWSRERGVQTVAASPAGRRLYSELHLRPPVVLFLGEERAGLSEATLRACTDRVRIPIVGRGDSLNVAVAGGVLLYDLHRRL